jgi:hypothetical protein
MVTVPLPYLWHFNTFNARNLEKKIQISVRSKQNCERKWKKRKET